MITPIKYKVKPGEQKNAEFKSKNLYFYSADKFKFFNKVKIL